MAEPTLATSLTELRSAVSRFMGFTRTYASLNSTESADVDEVIVRGLRRFYSPPVLPGETKAHEWSFLRPLRTVTTQAPYATGTITVANGVVTLSGGTFPSWAASGEMSFSGGLYTVSTRDGNTQVTLDDGEIDASAGTTYTLYLPQQDLPDDFGGISAGAFTYPPASGRASVPLTSDHSLRSARQRSGLQVGAPRLCSVRPKAKETATGTRWEVAWHPIPDAEYDLTYRMNVLPDALVASTNIHPYGGSAHAETILESCLSIAETMAPDNKRDLHQRLFMERLAASVMLDRQASEPDTYGICEDRSDDLADRRVQYLPSDSNFRVVLGP